MRQAAYQELYRVFSAQHDLLGEIYKTLVNDWKSENLSLRHFISPIAARNLGNDIPDTAVDVLLTVCAEKCRHVPTIFQTQGSHLRHQADEPLPSLCAASHGAEKISVPGRGHTWCWRPIEDFLRN